MLCGPRCPARAVRRRAPVQGRARSGLRVSRTPRVPFLNYQKGIYRAAAQRGPAALSIQTSANSPYDDEEGDDGFLYAYRAAPSTSRTTRAASSVRVSRCRSSTSSAHDQASIERSTRGTSRTTCPSEQRVSGVSRKASRPARRARTDPNRRSDREALRRRTSSAASSRSLPLASDSRVPRRRCAICRAAGGQPSRRRAHHR